MQATASALAWRAMDANAADQSPVVRKGLRILILGGTGYIGPYYVRAAVARGHRVAVFNRGRGSAQLPAVVERLIGDRNGDLESIRNREWDAVLDLATYGPVWVRTLGETLKERVKHYTFISTALVYASAVYNDRTTETSPVLEYSSNVDPYSVTTTENLNQYGVFKVLCEREGERQFPGRTLVLRPGYIVGPGDPNYALTFLAARASRGGDMLVAGDPLLPVQLIDVRDLADSTLRMAEQGIIGTYNMAGPAEPLQLGQLVKAVCRSSNAGTKPEWVSPPWLVARDDREVWRNALFWTFEAEGFAGMMRMSIERALANGLTIRPLSTTLTDVRTYYEQEPPERQAEMLMRWRRNPDNTLQKLTPMSWATYLKHENQALAAWKTLRRGNGTGCDA
jgi:2'-hydroxyisoflavone reductase